MIFRQCHGISKVDNKAKKTFLAPPKMRNSNRQVLVSFKKN